MTTIKRYRGTTCFKNLRARRICFEIRITRITVGWPGGKATFFELIKSGVGNLLNWWATFSSNKVPAGRHHSSGPKEKGLRPKFRPFFGRIDGEDRKKCLRQKFRRFFERIGDEDHKKGFKITKKLT